MDAQSLLCFQVLPPCEDCKIHVVIVTTIILYGIGIITLCLLLLSSVL